MTEITVRPFLQVAKANFKRTINPQSTTAFQAGAGAYHNTVDVGTSEENIATFGDIGTEGWAYFKNLDVTNYVRWGFSTGVYGGRMEPDEPVMFRMEPGLTLYLIANSAACLVEIFVAED